MLWRGLYKNHYGIRCTPCCLPIYSKRDLNRVEFFRQENTALKGFDLWGVREKISNSIDLIGFEIPRSECRYLSPPDCARKNIRGKNRSFIRL